MDSWTDIADRFIPLLFLSVKITLHCILLFFFILSFLTVIPLIYTDKKKFRQCLPTYIANYFIGKVHRNLPMKIFPWVFLFVFFNFLVMVVVRWRLWWWDGGCGGGEKRNDIGEGGGGEIYRGSGWNRWMILWMHYYL